jgi:hypothetical protein
VNCTNIVDYYGRRKVAYYQVKKCYNPLYASLKYDRLRLTAGETCTVVPYVIADADGVCDADIYVRADGREAARYHYSADCKKDAAVYFDDINLAVPACGALFFEITVQSQKSGFQNLIMLPVKAADGFVPLAPVKYYNDFYKHGKSFAARK